MTTMRSTRPSVPPPTQMTSARIGEKARFIMTAYRVRNCCHADSSMDTSILWRRIDLNRLL
jgi:hypothetical protein